MGEEDNSFVIGIFDCCREEYNESMFKPKMQSSMMFGDKGGDESEEDEEVVKGQNLFLIFGCAANKGVPATSKIATQFFEVLQQA